MKIFTTKAGKVEVLPSSRFIADQDYYHYLDSLALISNEEIGYDEEEVEDLDLGFSPAEVLPPLSDKLCGLKVVLNETI